MAATTATATHDQQHRAGDPAGRVTAPTAVRRRRRPGHAGRGRSTAWRSAGREGAHRASPPTGTGSTVSCRSPAPSPAAVRPPPSPTSAAPSAPDAAATPGRHGRHRVGRPAAAPRAPGPAARRGRSARPAGPHPRHQRLDDHADRHRPGRAGAGCPGPRWRRRSPPTPSKVRYTSPKNPESMAGVPDRLGVGPAVLADRRGEQAAAVDPDEGLGGASAAAVRDRRAAPRRRRCGPSKGTIWPRAQRQLGLLGGRRWRRRGRRRARRRPRWTTMPPLARPTSPRHARPRAGGWPGPRAPASARAEAAAKAPSPKASSGLDAAHPAGHAADDGEHARPRPGWRRRCQSTVRVDLAPGQRRGHRHEEQQRQARPGRRRC